MQEVEACLLAYFASVRAVLQLYPETPEQMEMISNSAMRAGFSGGLVIDFPNRYAAGMCPILKINIILCICLRHVVPKQRSITYAFLLAFHHLPIQSSLLRSVRAKMWLVFKVDPSR